MTRRPQHLSRATAGLGQALQTLAPAPTRRVVQSDLPRPPKGLVCDRGAACTCDEGPIAWACQHSRADLMAGQRDKVMAAVREQLALFFATCDPSADYAVIGETELQGEQHVVTLRFIRKA